MVQDDSAVTQNNTVSHAPTNLGPAEVELRKYEARLGVWKVGLGTFIVGLAGVLIPGAISFYNAHFENSRKETELRLSQQTAHQQYIKEFFTTAINQDIELRIRFADYFAHLSGADQEKLWQGYLDELRALREQKRKDINDLEKQLVEFKKQPPEARDTAQFDRVNRELYWASLEIGYVPTERSEVVKSSIVSSFEKKDRLYKETVDLVQRLATSNEPLTGNSPDVERFWTLYRKDLIGVESREFSQTMVNIGNLINKLIRANSAPTEELRREVTKLENLAYAEIDREAAFVQTRSAWDTLQLGGTYLGASPTAP